MFDNCFPGYELSDDENEDNRPNRDGGSCDEIQPQHESDILPASASPILVPPPVPSHAPFNFFAFVRQSSGHTASILQSIHLLDKRLPPGPIFDHSERAGGGVRCINFFSRTWSLTQQGTSVEPCVWSFPWAHRHYLAFHSMVPPVSQKVSTKGWGGYPDPYHSRWKVSTYSAYYILICILNILCILQVFGTMSDSFPL